MHRNALVPTEFIPPGRVIELGGQVELSSTPEFTAESAEKRRGREGRAPRSDPRVLDRFASLAMTGGPWTPAFAGVTVADGCPT